MSSRCLGEVADLVRAKCFRLRTKGSGLKPGSCLVLFRGLKAAATPGRDAEASRFHGHGAGRKEGRSQGLKPILWLPLLPGLKPRPISEAKTEADSLRE